MFNDYDYFLLIAEEMNISKAAKRAFTSQQSLSKYLKKLEEDHGVQLFERKPHFALTPAGEIVLQRARQMKVIAANMQMELDEIKSNHIGKIVFATSTGRVFQLIPIIFPIFNRVYPHVQVIAKMGLTEDTIPQVANGLVDVLLGISPVLTPQLKETVLDEEQFFLAASDELLMKYFPDEYPDCKIRFSQGVDLHEFQHIPFMGNSTVSHLKISIDNYLQKNEIELNYVLIVEDCEIQLRCAQEGNAVCFFPAMLKKLLYHLNKEKPYKHLNFFPLKNNTEANRISIVYQDKRRLPVYTKYFISLLSEQYRSNFVLYNDPL